MEVLDERGRLFGVVNVVDLLAVLFAVAVVVAGVAVVLDAGDSDEATLATRHVTLDLGEQPGYIVKQIDADDAAPLGEGPGNLTVTDVFVTPADGDRSAVTIRATVAGRLSERPEGEGAAFVVAGDPLVLGRSLTVATPEYRVDGTVTAVDRAGDSLAVSTSDVLLSTTMPADRAASIAAGDRARADGQTLATVESVTVYPTDDPTVRRVYLGLALRTITRQGRARFGGAPVGVGRSLTVPLDRYDVRGEVSRVGQAAPEGDVTTTRAVLELSDVRPERAANVRRGMTETVAGTQFARVRAVETEPTAVVVQSQDGEVFLRDHPRNVDVRLTVDLRTRQTATGLTFHGRPLRLNEPVRLELGPLTVRAEVVEIG